MVEPALRRDFGSVNALEVGREAGTVTSAVDTHRAAGFRVSSGDDGG